MIREAYVTFEMAKLLREKGFNEPICNCYLELDKGGYIDIEMSDECHQNERYDSEDSSWKFGTILLRPTHQMTMAWLREEKNIDIFPLLYRKHMDGVLEYSVCIYHYGCNMEIPIMVDTDYNNLIEAALLYTLKNLI